MTKLTHSHTRESSIDRTWTRRSSGLFIPPKMKGDRPIAIDLFCGAGGFSLGLMQAGFDVIAGSDNDEWAMITYLINLGAYPIDLVFATDADRERAEKALSQHFGFTHRRGQKRNPAIPGELLRASDVSGSNRQAVMPGREGVKHFFLGDIRLLKGADLLQRIGCERGEVDLVVGGPPCQGFSRMGKQNVMDPRNSLVFEWARLVLEIQPKAMMMENVPGIVDMVTTEGLPVVDTLCRVLSDGDFGTVDALKRSLLATAGVGGALRSQRDEKEKQPRPPKAAEPAPDLFSMAGLSV